MHWSARLAALLLAGGSVAGCSSNEQVPVIGSEGGPCNASPDPCCGMPDSGSCQNGVAIDAGPASRGDASDASTDAEQDSGQDAGTD